MKINYVDSLKKIIYPIEIEDNRNQLRDMVNRGDELYLSSPWIDFHCHIYEWVTSFGLNPDSIGYQKGVHLLVDAGSAGEETAQGLLKYVVPLSKTRILAFLNISSIGLVSMNEYFDLRKLSPEKTAECIRANKKFFLGVKVRSSGLIVEHKGIIPIKIAARAAQDSNCPMMVHFGENPPSNEENLSFIRGGDIISHCFHGKEHPLWDKNGQPIKALREALGRGALLDVAHGAASFQADVGAAAIANGYREFIISTDLHKRSIDGPVYGLAQTMSKFMALGLTLCEVLAGVTCLPAQAAGLVGWCDRPWENSTVFRIRKRCKNDIVFMDSDRRRILVERLIEPVAVIMERELIVI